MCCGEAQPEPFFGGTVAWIKSQQELAFRTKEFGILIFRTGVGREYPALDELKAEPTGRTDFPAIKAAMQRKLKQGLGRGIRKEDDHVTVWFADPRVHDLRNGILAAIPGRFHNAFLVALHQLRMRLAAVRTEQERFREALLVHYGRRCVVTGSNVEAVLEAAHRPGKSWKAGHNRVEDGLLVRSDIHKLIDDGLLVIKDNVVKVDPSVAAEYGQYDGKVIGG